MRKKNAGESALSCPSDSFTTARVIAHHFQLVCHGERGVQFQSYEPSRIGQIIDPYYATVRHLDLSEQVDA